MRVGPYDASGNPAAAGDDVVGLRRLRAVQKFGLGRIGGDGCRNVRQEQGTVKLAHPGFVTVTDDVRTESRGLAGVMRLRLHPATVLWLRLGGFRSVARETRWR
jgi:hypothetical protein